MNPNEGGNSQFSSNSCRNSKTGSNSEKSDDESIDNLSTHPEYSSNSIKEFQSSDGFSEIDSKGEEPFKPDDSSLSFSCIYHETVIYPQIGNLLICKECFCFTYNKHSKKKQFIIPYTNIKWCNVRKNLRVFTIKTLDEKKYSFTSVSSCNTLEIVVQDIMSQYRHKFQVFRSKSNLSELTKSKEFVSPNYTESLDQTSLNQFDGASDSSPIEGYRAFSQLELDEEYGDHGCDCAELKTLIISKDIEVNIHKIYDALFTSTSSVNIEFFEKFNITDVHESDPDTSNENFICIPYTYNIKSDVPLVSKIIACFAKRFVWKSNVKGHHIKVIVECTTLNPTVITQMMYCITAKGPELTTIKASFTTTCNTAFSGKYISGIASNHTKTMSLKLFEILESHLVKSRGSISCESLIGKPSNSKRNPLSLNSENNSIHKVDFDPRRMAEKIEKLERSYLEFLKSNSRQNTIYSVLLVVLYSLVIYLVWS